MPRKSFAPSILVLAPQPFFQHRGTPIAVRLLVRELALLGYQVHLLTFHEGEEVVIPGVVQHRTAAIPGVKNVPPSFSWKKVVSDIGMLFSALALHRRYRFDLIHAVEEAVYTALLMKRLHAVPYVYDMDSSLALQLTEKFPWLGPCRNLLGRCERLVIRQSRGVVAVCRELEGLARAAAPENLIVRLEDISLLEDTVPAEESLRQSFRINGPIMLYVGNLERYQGIDLLLAAFQQALADGCQGTLVLIGGTPEKIAAYRDQADKLGIAAEVRFCGPRPVEALGHYLSQADILLSPRIQGNNTPMKLYSYLDSGKVVLATALPTHTQVLRDDFACLVAPEKMAMAAAMVALLADPERCRELGERGRQVARENHSLAAFQGRLAEFYDRLLPRSA